MAKALYQSLFLAILTLFVFITAPQSYAPNALERYVQRPDQTFAWEIETQATINEFTVTHVKMQSQTWRGHVWSHDLKIISPQRVRHPELALLFITGDHSETRSHETLQAWADRAGAVVAEVTRVPNQPLYDGRKEDALFAYTFDQDLRTGDETWPALFPMTKSAVRAMDTIQAWAHEKHRQKIEKFVVAGASNAAGPHGLRVPSMRV